MGEKGKIKPQNRTKLTIDVGLTSAEGQHNRNTE